MTSAPTPRSRTLSSLLSEPANSYTLRSNDSSAASPNPGKALPSPPTPAFQFHRRGSCAEGVDAGEPSPTASSSGSSGLDGEDGHTAPAASTRVVLRSRPPRTPSPPRWDHEAFSLSLSFNGNLSQTSTSHDSAPPAFFPQQRVGFSPRLKVRSHRGLPLSLIGGMTLGVTGLISVPSICRSTGEQAVDPQTGEAKWKSKRVHVDFVTDLTPGIKIWKTDAEAAAGRGAREVLPMGTYVLPLSMRIPSSDKLPPSFSCPYFTISYTMSVAIWSSAVHPATGQPLNCKVFSAPFEVLPSTLPTGPPDAPRIVWDGGRRSHAAAAAGEAIGGIWEGLRRVVSLGGGRAEASPAPSASSSRPTLQRSVRSENFLVPKNRSLVSASRSLRTPPSTVAVKAPAHEAGWSYVVRPRLPHSSFSPSAHACIPLNISIAYRPGSVSTPGMKTDVYVRVSLVRTVFVRERGCDAGTEAVDSLLPEEMVMDLYKKEEKEVGARWAFFPAESIEDGSIKAEVGLPLFNADGTGWQHGYSTSISLGPELPPPTLASPASAGTITSSWFSPTLRQRPPVEKEYARFLHVENKFSVVVEVGFANRSAEDGGEGPLGRALDQLRESGAVDVPSAGAFTSPLEPSSSSDASRPFATPYHLSHSRTSNCSEGGLVRTPEKPAFPGKMRVMRIPVTIGSVAEPMLECLASPTGSPREQPRPASPTVASPGSPPPSPSPQRLSTRAWSRQSGDEEDSSEEQSASSSSSATEREAQREAERSASAAASYAEEDNRRVDADAWLCPPPDYDSALAVAPAYVFF